MPPYTHLIRKPKEIKKQILLCEQKYQDQRAITFCDEIKVLFKQACQIAQKVKSSNTERNNAGKYQRKLQRRLKKLCKTPLCDKNIAKMEPGYIYRNGKKEKITVTYLNIDLETLRQSGLIESYRQQHNGEKYYFSKEPFRRE